MFLNPIKLDTIHAISRLCEVCPCSGSNFLPLKMSTNNHIGANRQSIRCNGAKCPHGLKASASLAQNVRIHDTLTQNIRIGYNCLDPLAKNVRQGICCTFNIYPILMVLDTYM